MVGIGETGLDFYRNLSPQATQMKVFSDFLHLSGELHLPVVIHDRGRPRRRAGLPHRVSGRGTRRGSSTAFPGDWEYAKVCMDLGFYISIAGPVTFPKAKELHEVVKKLPADRILLETDCPFLAPAPYRGKQNEPAYIVHTAQAVAELRGEDVQEVHEYTARNVRDVLGLDNPGTDTAEKRFLIVRHFRPALHHLNNSNNVAECRRYVSAWKRTEDYNSVQVTVSPSISSRRRKQLTR